MAEINEKLFVEIYSKNEHTWGELSRLFDVPERTLQRYAERLVSQGKILPKRVLSSSREKSRWSHKEIFEEVQVYLDNARQVFKVHSDIYKDLKLKAPWSKNKQTEDLALVWSDMHTGMINRDPVTGKDTYNKQIQEEELKTFGRGIIRFYNLYKPSYNLETLYIFLNGDNITNDRIYEGQKMEITMNVGTQVIKTVEYISDTVKLVAPCFQKIVIVVMSGNHARTTPKPISEEATNSFEYLMGMLLKERFHDNKRIEVIVPESYVHTIEIRGHKYLLTHGNIVRGGTLNSIERATKNLATLAYKEFYDTIIIGHFHTALKLRITPETTLLVNGCWIHNDDYAYHKLHKFSSATQYLFSISKRSAMHNLQEIYLRWR